MNTDELEFFTTWAAAMLGKAKFAAAVEKNICGNASHRVRREAIPDSVQVAVGAPALDRLIGTYTAKDKMVLTVTMTGNHLVVLAGGSKFELYPASENNFAMKERDIKVAFSVDKAGKGQGLVVRERGAIVAEAKVSAP